jgi:uncharacterized protein (TIGR03435 family)
VYSTLITLALSISSTKSIVYSSISTSAARFSSKAGMTSTRRHPLVHVVVMVAIASVALQLEARNGQSTEAFDVASIKTAAGERRAGVPAASPDRFIRPDATLLDLIRYAYNVQDFQIEGGPTWMRSARFEVNARASSAPAALEGMRLLVRRLLADRFTLRARTESREMPHFALIVARRDGRLGEKLRPSVFDCEAALASVAASADDLARCDLRFRPKMAQGNGGRPSIVSMTLILRGVRISRLASLLQNEVQRVIVDKTDLAGTFDVELEFAPAGRFRPAGLPGPPSPPSDGAPLETAVQEQLGLTLQSVRGPVPVLVIDGAELPTPD